MCLSVVTNKRPVKQGYKVFARINGKLYGEFINRSKVRPRHQWLHEKDYIGNFRKETISLRDEGRTCYLRGFHVYHSLKDVKARLKQKGRFGYDHNHEIWRVRVKEPVCVGNQCFSTFSGMESHSVTVCKQIFIEKQVADTVK